MLELNSVQYKMARIKKIYINSPMYTLVVANSGVDNTTRSCNLTGSASHLSKKKKVKINQNAPKIVNDQNYVSDQNYGNDQNYVALL